jgi:hypothetical protein
MLTTSFLECGEANTQNFGSFLLRINEEGAENLECDG